MSILPLFQINKIFLLFRNSANRLRTAAANYLLQLLLLLNIEFSLANEEDNVQHTRVDASRDRGQCIVLWWILLDYRAFIVSQIRLKGMVWFGCTLLHPLLIYSLATSNNSNNHLVLPSQKNNNTPTINKMADQEQNSIEHDPTRSSRRSRQSNNVTKSALMKLRMVGMEKKELPHHVDLKRASVLVPLFERDNTNNNQIIEPSSSIKELSSSQSYKSNLHVLFTQRPHTLSSHPGEVCFPGGRQDPEDEGDDVVTAMREAREEVGLHPQYIDAIGRMETVESKHSLCVTPIIGLIRPSLVAEPSQLKLNVQEVEAAFAVPLEYFAKAENCVSKKTVEWNGGDFVIRTYLFDDLESGRQFRIWGLTAHVIHEVAKMAFCSSSK